MVLGLGLLVVLGSKIFIHQGFRSGIGRAPTGFLGRKFWTMKWSDRTAQGFSPGLGGFVEVP